MIRRWAWLCPLGLLAGGGGGAAARGPTTSDAARAPVSDWRRFATAADRQRLRQWREAWVTALAMARRTSAEAIAAQGELFAFDTAQAGPMPPPGDYRCRVFKLGAKRAGMSDFITSPWFACRVEASGSGQFTLAKVSGAQRAVGTLYEADGMRAVFLGTLMLGDERRPFAYGRDANRDLAGWIDRVGPARWRMALPYPAFESTLDVVELVPAG